MNRQKRLSWIGIIAFLAGCTSPLGFCDQSQPCPDGSYCVVEKKSTGICVWGKLGEEGVTIPDIRFEVPGGEISNGEKTAKPLLRIQVDVYGASTSIDIQVEEPGGGKRVLECMKQETSQGQHQRLECTPIAEREGGYRLAVEASNAQGRAVENFSWHFEKRALQVQILLEKKKEWERDDTLHAQLQVLDEVDLAGVELFAGERRTLSEPCRAGMDFFPSPNTVCFALSLVELSDLPHGPYALELRAESVDKAGNHASKSQVFDIQISRRLWTLDLAGGLLSTTGVVTRKGELVLLRREGAETSVVGINTHGQEKVWRSGLPDPGIAQLLLGNHQGKDVLLVNCVSNSVIGNGFFVVDMQLMGKPLTTVCTNLARVEGNWALLQSGADKDLVVARKVSGSNGSVLEACRFRFGLTGLSWSFHCEASGVLPPEGSSNSEIMVRQTSEGVARVFIGSQEHHWCAMEWSDENGWSEGCVAQGPSVAGLVQVRLELLGPEQLWVTLFREDNTSVVKNFGGNTGFEEVGVWHSLYPRLVDTGGELIAKADKTKEPGVLRFSADGQLLHQRGVQIGDIVLMEGGELIFPTEKEGELGVSCIKADMRPCWSETNTSEGGYGQVLGVLPLSPTRSIAVFWDGRGSNNDFVSNGGIIAGFLVDSPGLKKDAPWPMRKHDPCLSFNASTPVDGCWGEAKMWLQ
ncbi:MAG: hypothetical protein FWC28_07865 [Proteobacteria bacterium]|nr:hypothetical protein [Cystobacterineae bacterium]MCL2258572.1 hypothetical protein [Cystobacterineae bacterium]MCL2315147.1 hypothetical protein [Pseudomonadota bacterium]